MLDSAPATEVAPPAIKPTETSAEDLGTGHDQGRVRGGTPSVATAPPPPSPPPADRKGGRDLGAAEDFARRLAEHAEGTAAARQGALDDFEAEVLAVVGAAPLPVADRFVTDALRGATVAVDARIEPISEAQDAALQGSRQRERDARDRQVAAQGEPGDLLDAVAQAASATLAAAITLARAALEALASFCEQALASLEAATTRALNGLRDVVLPALGAEFRGDVADPAGPVVRAALLLAGLPPDAVLGLFGRSERTLEAIWDDPAAFAGHAADAVTGGVGQFQDHFGQHLRAGFVGWIGEELGVAGLTLPAKWDAAGFLDLGAQVLGLTGDHVRERLEEKLGEENAALVEEGWKALLALLGGGIDGLWEHLAQRVGDVVPVVMEGIREFVVEEVVLEAGKKLATLWIPGSAVLQGLILAWKVFQWVREKAQRIVGFVDGMLGQVEPLAQGQVDPAAAVVEAQLAGSLPMAISFLAEITGVSDLIGGLTDTLKLLQGVVEGGIDQVIEGAEKLAKQALQALSGGEDDEAPPPAGLDGAPDEEKVGQMLRLDGVGEASLGATQPALLRRGRGRWRREAGTDQGFLEEVAAEIGGPVGQRKLGELRREEQPRAVQAIGPYSTDVADRWVRSPQRGPEALYKEMAGPARDLTGLGRLQGEEISSVFRLQGARDFFNHHVPKERPAADLTWEAWAQQVNGQEIPQAGLIGRFLADRWWTPDRRLIERADKSIPGFDETCVLNALAPEWYPDGTVTLTAETPAFDLVTPTAFDGMMSPLWVQDSPYHLAVTGGGLPELIGRGRIAPSQVTSIRADGLQAGPMGKALRDVGRREPAERWAEKDGAPAAASDGPDEVEVREIQQQVAQTTRAQRSMAEGHWQQHERDRGGQGP